MRSFIPLLAALGAVATLAAIAGWAVATDIVQAPQASPNWIRASPIAHRGMHTGNAETPENSLAAFSAAVARGYPIELDVHLSADGIPVVFHDETLERMTGDPRRVSDLTSEELASLRLLGSDERIPTLADVLALVDIRTQVLIEIKQRGAVGPLERAVVDVIQNHPTEVAIQSFNPYSLAYVRRIAPELPRGQLSGSFAGEDLPVWQVFALRHALMNWASDPAFIAYELDALPTWSTSIQRMRGRPLLGWTASDPAAFDRAQHIADGVIFGPGAF